MTVAERVAEMNTAFGRLVNRHGPRVKRLTFCVSEETRQQIEAMAAAWETTQASVGAEILEAAMPEAWAAFEEARA